MASNVTEKLLKELYFMCLMSDNVIENPLASIGVRETAFKVLRPLIQQTAWKAVEVMTEVVQKREISDDVNSFFLVVYTVLGKDIYRLILLKISDGISEDDGIFMIQSYKCVSYLRLMDFKTIITIFSKKQALTEEVTSEVTADTANITASLSDALPTQRHKYASSTSLPNGCNLVEHSGNSWISIREERLCDLVPQVYETKAELTRRTTVHEPVETPDVPISYSVKQSFGEGYTELLARDRPLDASILAFADIDDLFPKNMPPWIMDNDDSTVTANAWGPISSPNKTPSTPSAELHTSAPLDNEQATVMPSTSDTIWMDRLSKRQETPLGSLFANVADLFSTNELRPAFAEGAEENTTSVAPPEESIDSSNGLGGFDFPCMYESDWKEEIGFSSLPVEPSNSTRLFPINLPDGILENLENENANKQ